MYYNAFDDQPASYDGAAGRLELYDVQQSALFVSESQALQALAAVAGATAAVPTLERQGRAMAALVNGSLWDEAGSDEGLLQFCPPHSRLYEEHL
jgi:hypothetical protein